MSTGRRLDHLFRPITPQIDPLDPRAYQRAIQTEKSCDEVLRDLRSLIVPDIVIAETRSTYVVFAPDERRWYGPKLATGIAIAIVILLLLATAKNTVSIAFLPLALLAYAPLFFDNRPLLAVSAVSDERGVTRVTAHGLATDTLDRALETYFSGLPPASIANH